MLNGCAWERSGRYPHTVWGPSDIAGPVRQAVAPMRTQSVRGRAWAARPAARAKRLGAWRGRSGSADTSDERLS